MRMGYFGAKSFVQEDQIYRTGNLYAVDSTFFQIFPLTFLYGDASIALKRPNSLVLTETMARAIFENENPLGRTIATREGITYLVTGVVKDFPPNSHFACGALESLYTYDVNRNWLDLWYSTYIHFRADTDINAFRKKLEDVVIRYVGPEAEHKLGVPIRQFLQSGNTYAFEIQPLSSIYLHSFRDYRIDPNTEWSNVRMGDVIHVYISAAIAAFILILAVINFINLSTAKSERRAREVGVRKTFGSGRFSLIFQFIGEAMAMTGAATVIGVALLLIFLPFFNDLVGRQLTFFLVDKYWTVPLLFAFVVVVGLLAGIYPAIYLSSFAPGKVLKSVHKIDNGRGMLRSGLVVVQFSVAIGLVIATTVIQHQLDFITRKDLGFRKDLLVTMSIGRALDGHLETFKTELLNHPGVISVTNSSRIFSTGIPGTAFLYNKKSGTDPFMCQYMETDTDFVETFGIQMASGRFFSENFPSDSTAVVVNEAAARAMTSEDPIGKDVISLDAREEGKPYRVIGILKDFNYESLHREVRPLVLRLGAPRQIANMLTLRLSPSNVHGTIGFIEEKWKTLTSDDQPFSFTFIDVALENMYRTEEKIRLIVGVFSFLAIFVACIGLFGLAAFITEQRTREIGIRKVLGASSGNIVLTLSKEFALWVAAANIIAWPVAYFAMQRWLENFAFRIDIELWIFVVAAALTFSIAIATVAVQTVKASRKNPVASLKHE
jgi:putative ABC transport system permease protein